MDIDLLIAMLKKREDGMREYIGKSIGEDKAHYIGWLRGIQCSRELVEYLRGKGKDET